MKQLLAAVLAAVLQTPAEVPEPVSIEQRLEKKYAEGETLDYTVMWMKVTGGTGRMTIAPHGDEKQNYRITSVAKSSGSLGKLFKIRDEIETIVARSDFSTLRYTKKLDERGDKMNEVTVIEDGVATRTRQKVRKLPVPRPILDPISVIYHFRKLDLTPGKTYEVTLYADLKLYTVTAKALRRETIVTPAGTFSTILMEPEMKNAGKPREEKLHIWYSDDDQRLPVRIRTEVGFGSVTATLRSVSSGVRSIDPPPLRR